MARPYVPAALALAAVALSACGAGSSGDVAQIKQTITGFAAAGGPRACDYLTVDAMQELYVGGGRARADGGARATAACRAQAAFFTGDPVKVTRVWFPMAHRAKAYASLIHGKRAYTVTLRQAGGSWRINRVQH